MSQVFDNKQPYPITNKQPYPVTNKQPYPFPSKAPGPVRPSYVPLKEAPKLQNQENINQLFKTVMFDNISEIKLMISKTNTPLNIRNIDDKGLIHFVLENDNIESEDEKLEIIKFLLEHGASLSYDKYNVCPLHLACKKQYAKITKFLLKSSDVNACDSNGMNALHYLVQGDVKQCSDDKQIGKIIEKNPKTDIITKEMKNISVEILNKLNDKDIKEIIKPLNKKLLKLDKYYPEKFDTTNLLEDIKKKIIEDKQSKEGKKIEIEKLINNYIIKIKNDMKNNFNDVLSVVDDEEIKMLKNGDDLKEKIIKKDDNNIEKALDGFKKEIEKFGKYVGEMCDNIHIGEARFTKSITEIKDVTDSRVSIVKLNKDPKPLDDKLAEYKDKDQNLWKKEKYIQLSYLNDDGDIDITKYCKPVKNVEYSITKGLLAWVAEIQKHISSIEKKITKLNNTNLLEIYEFVIIDILTDMFNIIQCCIKLLNISEKIKKFNTIIKKTITDNQMYGPDKKKISSPPSLFDKPYSAEFTPKSFYDRCNNIINDHLNKIISAINNSSTIKLINNIEKGDSNEQYNNTFNIRLKHIEKIPKNLESYIKEITDIYKSTQEQRIYIYKKYFHVIDSTYLPIYICDGCDEKGRKGYLIKPIKGNNGKLRIVYDGKDDLDYSDKGKIKNIYFDDISESNYAKASEYKIGKIAKQPKLKEDMDFTSENLNNYIKFLKLYLIKKVMDGLSGEIDEKDLDKNIKVNFIYKLEKLGTYGDINHEELFLEYVIKITNNIINKFVENSIYTSINDYIHNFIKTSKNLNVGEKDFDIHPIELNYNAGLNELYKSFIGKIEEEKDISKLDTLFSQTLYPAILIEDESEPHNKFPIYDQNYKLTKKDNNYKCYEINYDIVELLYNASINMNKKDITGSSPLFYAIEINNYDLIKKLLSKSIISIVEPSIKNNFGITPYKHFINLYRLHLDQFVVDKDNLDMKGLINKFTKPILNDIKEIMLKNPKYKNNIIRYLDIVFPQLLIMYNNMLYFYAQSYRNNWSYNENNNLKNLLSNIENDESKKNDYFDYKQYELPILKNIKDNLINGVNNKEVVDNSIKFNNIAELKKKNKKIIEKKIKEKEAIVNILNSLRTERDKYKLDSDKYGHIIKQIEIKINYVVSQKNILDREILKLQIIDNAIKIDDENDINTSKTEFNEDIMNNIEEIHLEDKQLTHKLVSLKHDAIFNNIRKMHENIAKKVNIVCNDKDICTDYIFYNDLWKKFITSDNLDNMSNIHLKLVMGESKLINEMEKITNNNYKGATEIFKNFEIINEFYEKILTTTINISNQLPYNYNYEENYILSETLDIITHIVKHTLCSNLYYTVIKILAKYLIQLNKLDIKNKETIYKEIQNSKLKERIHNYILLEMPKSLVKKKLDIYENDYEETVLDVDKLFEKLLNIITSSEEFPFPKDSTLEINLKGVIFEYYKDLFQLVIPRMKTFIDDYNKFILNEGRFVKCAKLINKHVGELKH